MQTILVFILGLVALPFFIWVLIGEVQHSKMCTRKAKEEMEFFRSFREYLESLEKSSN